MLQRELEFMIPPDVDSAKLNTKDWPLLLKVKINIYLPSHNCCQKLNSDGAEEEMKLCILKKTFEWKQD